MACDWWIKYLYRVELEIIKFQYFFKVPQRVRPIRKEVIVGKKKIWKYFEGSKESPWESEKYVYFSYDFCIERNSLKVSNVALTSTICERIYHSMSPMNTEWDLQMRDIGISAFSQPCNENIYIRESKSLNRDPLQQQS